MFQADSKLGLRINMDFGLRINVNFDCKSYSAALLYELFVCKYVKRLILSYFY